MDDIAQLIPMLWEHPVHRLLAGVVVVELVAVAGLLVTLTFQARRRLRDARQFRELLERLDELADNGSERLVEWFEQQDERSEQTVRKAFVELGTSDHRELLGQAWRRLEFGAAEREKLTGGTDRERLEAIRRLYVFADEDDLDAVRQGLERSSDHRFRLVAAQLLARLDRGVDAVRALEGVHIERRITEQPVFATFRALSADQLENVVGSDLSELGPRIRLVLLEVAAEKGVSSVDDEVEQMAESHDLEARLGACRIGVALGGRRGRRILRRRIADESWEVRAQAARGIGEIGTAEEIPLLEYVAEDAYFWVRENARWAIEQLADRDPDLLEESLDEEPPESEAPEESDEPEDKQPVAATSEEPS